MNKLETKEAVEILLSEKKKAEANLAKAYDSYCLLPNEHDQEDWDNYSALVAALEMAVQAMEKQVPKKPTVPVDTWLCPSCGESVEYQQKLGDNVLYHGQHDFCPKCGQKICWEGGRVMDNQEAIASSKTLCHTCDLFPKCAHEKPECFQAIELAISALQEQDSETRKICDTCKHDPPSKKWPCVDCDMREPADKWEPKDGTDINVGGMVSRQKVFDLWDKYHPTIAVNAIAYDKALRSLPSAQKKGYTKADYITALHKEYGCSLTRAEEAHQKALEYLRNTSMMKG